MAKLAVLFDRQEAKRRWHYGLNTFQIYIEEILRHAGIPFEWIDDPGQIETVCPDLLVVALIKDRKEFVSPILEYARQGGGVISIAGMDSIADEVGCISIPPVQPGYARMPEGWIHDTPIRFLRASPWRRISEHSATWKEIGDLLEGEPNGTRYGAVLQQFPFHAGFFDRWAVEVTDTIVGMQQGMEPVLKDGYPAPDGTANVNDGILKADDRIEMNWEFDRLRTTTETPYFAYPYADWWRELLVSHILRRALDKGLTLPFVGRWPNGITCMATISHDSDHNRDEHALTTLEVLKECGIHSTWCIIEPGYSLEIYDRLIAEGHELAVHFNALEQSEGIWSGEEFERQLVWLREVSGQPSIVSNKNHYFRFEGWGELFSWCEQNGISVDQTRGPSKGGNTGFLFGTCLPYRPVAWWDENNRFYEVLEIGLLTQDLDHPNVVDSSVLIPFLQQVQQVSGVAHFLFHNVHLHNLENVRNALKKVVKLARNIGYEFWTSRQIAEWERSRRGVKIIGIQATGEVIFEAEVPIENVDIWIPVQENEMPTEGLRDKRYGVWCKKMVCSGRAL